MTPLRTQPAPVPSGRGRTLAVASLDIGRVLADRDGVTFRARSTCMYPAVRPGDVLHVRSCPAAEVALGDIAVCRALTYLFGHRVVGKGYSGGRAHIVTRPDRSRRESDAPTFDDDLLGIVVAISRNGSPVSPAHAAHRRAGRAYLRARLALIEAEPRARAVLARVARLLQERTLYRQIAGRSFRHGGARVRFAVRVPLNATLGDAVFREAAPGEFDPSVAWNGRRPQRFTLVALAAHGGAPAGSLAVVRDADGGWQTDDPWVRVRYRGTGLEDDLRRHALAILERSGPPAAGART